MLAIGSKQDSKYSGLLTATQFWETVVWNFYYKLRGTPLAVAALHKWRKKMQPRKQQGILHFFNKESFSFQKITTLKVDMKQVP